MTHPELRPGDSILIYYNPRRKRHIARLERDKTELGDFDSYQAAKTAMASYKTTKIFHAGPGGIRQLERQTHCQCCGQELPDQPLR